MPPESGMESRRGPGAQPLRRRRVVQPHSSVFRRRGLQLLLIFVTLVLIVDALVGEKGLMESMNARQQYRELAASLDRIRRDNTALRDDVRRLKEDPQTIESLARQELGLIRPGEVVFILKDLKEQQK